MLGWQALFWLLSAENFSKRRKRPFTKNVHCHKSLYRDALLCYGTVITTFIITILINFDTFINSRQFAKRNKFERKEIIIVFQVRTAEHIASPKIRIIYFCIFMRNVEVLRILSPYMCYISYARFLFPSISSQPLIYQMKV